MTLSDDTAAELRPGLADRLHSPVMAWIILLCGLGLTVTAWFLTSSAVNQRALDRLEFRSYEIETTIRDRMITYEQVLWGGVGLFAASNSVNRQEWKAYVDTLRISQHWPGIQGLGYAVPVSPDELAAHTKAIRAEGFPDYSVRPPGPRDRYTAIVFLEPFDWRNKRAFGYDMSSNAMRWQAMAKARSTGKASTSGMITLVQETDKDVQKGFLTYLPDYEPGKPIETTEQREAALRGWVYAAFRMGDLMHNIQDVHDRELDYEIFDGTEISNEHLMFDSDNTFSGAKALQAAQDSSQLLARRSTMQLQGRTWTIVFSAKRSSLVGSEENHPTLVAVGGLIIDLLLFYVITSMAFLQRRARNMAAQMTRDIRIAQQKLQAKTKELETYATQLEQSNSDLEQFASVASHDLQEPLRKVVSSCQILEENLGEKLTEEEQMFLGFAVDGSLRMRQLVQDLLSYSRIGRTKESLKPIDLNKILDDALANLSSLIEESDAVIERGEMQTIEGRKTQLLQLVQNLLSNALKYRNETTAPIIKIACERDDDVIRLTVSDNGIGIAETYQLQIFELFERLHGRDSYAGTGIGLAVCKKVVEQHSGHISIVSQEGKGSTFTVELPVRQPTRVVSAAAP